MELEDWWSLVIVPLVLLTVITGSQPFSPGTCKRNAKPDSFLLHFLGYYDSWASRGFCVVLQRSTRGSNTP